MQKLGENGDPQWIDENDPDLPGVRLTENIVRREGIRCISDGEGGAISVWADERNGGFDLYAQRLTSDGEIADGWLEDNQVVNCAGNNQFGHAVISDGDGGIILAWISGWRSGGDIYANKMDIDGNLIWDNDPEEGVAICTTEGSNYNISLCSDGFGGVFVSWTGYRENQEGGDIYCQRIDEDGIILWSDNGEIVCDAPEAQNYSMIVPVEQGEAVVVWEDERNNTYSDIYMQKIAGEDSIILLWGAEGEETQGLLLSNAYRNQKFPSLVSDGEGGVIVVWTDERVYEYEADIYAQQIDHEGRKIWDNGNDVIVSGARQLQTSPSLHLLGDVAGLAWLDKRDGSPAVYTQFLEIESGDAILTDDGEQIIFGIGYNVENPKISIDGDNLWFAWVDDRWGAMGRYIYAQRANISDGNLQFETNGIPIVLKDLNDRYTDNMDSVVIAPDGDGGLLIACKQVYRDYQFVIVTQRISEYGELLWGDEGSRAAPGEVYRDQTRPRILPTDNGGMFVAFHIYIGPSWWQNILLQKMSPTGVAQWTDEDYNAVLVTNFDYDHRVQGIEYFDNGTIIIVYVQMEPEDYRIYAHCFDTGGNPVWDEPVAICEAEGIQHRAKLAKIHNGILVVWEDGRRGQPIKDIYGQVIREDGSLRWEEDGLVLIEEDYAQENIALGIREEGAYSFWLAWQDCRDLGSHIYAQRFNWDGSAIFEPASGIPVCTTETYQCNPKIVVGNEQDAYIVWQDEENYFLVDLRYTHLDSDGNPIDDRYENGGMILSDARHQQINANIVKDGEGGFITVWEDLRSAVHEFRYDVYAQRVNDGLVGTREREVSAVPEKWSLDAVYPNPFNSSLMVKVSLPKQSELRVAVYNLLGQEAAVLADGQYSAGHRHFTFDASNFSSGIYFVRATVPGKMNEVRKVVLVN